MTIEALLAISPLDGRYAEKLDPLRQIFSEYGLIKYRVIVEVRFLTRLSQSQLLPGKTGFSVEAKQILNSIIEHFSLNDAKRVKEIEATTNHDVKAVEYLIKEHVAQNEALHAVSEFIHFGLTSEDVNNLAYGMMLLAAREDCILPALQNLLTLMRKFAHNFAALPMLARTHGQSATPTTVGKEFANVIARLEKQIAGLKQVAMMGKLNGASGNYNAFVAAYPEVDWQAISKQFVTELGLNWNPYTTQIEPHDCMAEMFSSLQRINTILIDFCRDVWGYIALNYFIQKPVKNEVGSSTMPHKINPIDFENAEGNLGMANALFEHMAAKLPISRWQRDLSDSTVLRNVGVAFGHSLLAYQAIEKGLYKIEPNVDVLKADLNQHWEVLAEPIQTVMRRYQLQEPYEQLKAFTRGKKIDKETLHQFINSLALPDDAKKQLLSLTPENYLGLAETLARKI